VTICAVYINVTVGGIGNKVSLCVNHWIFYSNNS